VGLFQVRTLSGRDHRAFVSFVAVRYRQRLERFLSRRLANRMDTSDLAQEIYLRLLRSEQHEEVRNPEAYLLTIARHAAYEHSARQAAQPTLIDIAELTPKLPTSTDDGPDEQAYRQQQLQSLHDALRELPAKAQAVLLLRGRDGFTVKEIGRQIGISPSMVKKYLTRALSHCRQRLDPAKRG
jgi:RNA polymerase sigma factor (sigma-70 family)